MWGIPDWAHQGTEVQDEEKEALRAHLEVLCTDVLWERCSTIIWCWDCRIDAVWVSVEYGWSENRREDCTRGCACFCVHFVRVDYQCLRSLSRLPAMRWDFALTKVGREMWQSMRRWLLPIRLVILCRICIFGCKVRAGNGLESHYIRCKIYFIITRLSLWSIPSRYQRAGEPWAHLTWSLRWSGVGGIGSTIKCNAW